MMTCRYPGDCSEFVIGQVMGPDTAGGSVVATRAFYDGRHTAVYFRPLSGLEVLRMVRGSFGEFRLPAEPDE